MEYWGITRCEIHSMGIDVINSDEVWTSLKGVCEEAGVSYNGAVKGKREFYRKGRLIVIRSVGINKIKGRGGFRE